jgi:HD-like signal output (HDOD) protein
VRPIAGSVGQEGEQNRLLEIIMNTRDLPAMPHIACKVLELSSNPDTSAQQLQQVIADDQAMTARILKIANSALYSCSRKIKTLTEAIVMLGFNTIRSLVVTSASRNLYVSSSKRMGLKERLMWEHSIGAAFGCRLLAKQRYPHLMEEAFLAGLMHDIGKLVLNQQAAEQYDDIVQIVYNENRAFCETEREVFGFDHAEVGERLINKWKLSPLLERAIADHHRPEALTADNPLLLLLDLSNRLCRRLGIGFLEDASLDLAAAPPNLHLQLGAEALEDIAAQLQGALEEEMEIFIA